LTECGKSRIENGLEPDTKGQTRHKPHSALAPATRPPDLPTYR
jgi:hypothetical protein